MGFSPRYTPVTGRLHTRYAPVRRSSPKYCYLALPLDLHVLSLPLAFILSQDQTLHCKNCSFLPFDSSSCLTHISICMSTHAISIFSSFQISLVSCRRFLWRKTGAKVQPFFIPAKYFFNFFLFFVRSGWFTICYVQKFFSGGVDMAGCSGRREVFSMDFSGELDMWRCGRITQVTVFL